MEQPIQLKAGPVELNETPGMILGMAKEQAREFERERKRVRRKPEPDFFQRRIDLRSFVLSPDGYEGPMMAFYVAFIPYAVGTLFLFLFIARAQAEYFMEFNLTSYFIIWAIGYEVCAGTILAAIFVAWLKEFSRRHREKGKEHRQNVF